MEDAVATPGVKPAILPDAADLVVRLVQYFETSEEMSIDSRAFSEKCRDYKDGRQYTAAEKKKLNDRKQPALVWNRVKRKVNFLTGYEIQQRMDPRAFPRNAPVDEDGAAAATDALRYVQDEQMLPEKFSDSFEDGIVEGYGGLEILYDPKTGCPDLKYWEWDRLFYDPYSSKHDFSDATYKGGVVWMDEEQAKRAYPDKASAIGLTIEMETNASQTKTYDDKPAFNAWASLGKRKRVRIVQIYYLEKGEWHWAHYTKGGILKGGAAVPFLDKDGDTECPLELWSCYVDRDNNRYGEVAELLDIQDEINKRRAKSLYRLMTRQVVMDKGAVDRKEEVRNELARPDGVIEVNPGRKFDIQENTDQTSGELQLLQEAKAEMEFAGPNASLMGDTRSGASGRAIIAAQQGGLSELGRVQARYRNFKLRVYRQIWNRVRQFWTEEKWIRVTDDEKNVKFVGLNRPETMGDVILAQAKAQGIPEEEMAALEQQLKADPRAQQQTGRKLNNLAELDVDIVLDETVDTVTLQQEQFSELVELAKAGFPIPPEAIIQASSIRNKDKILAAMKSQQSPQTPPEVQELQMRGMAAKVAESETKVAKTAAETDKLRSETVQGKISFAAQAPQPPMPQWNNGQQPV
jgi:hypothetical protein